MSYTLRSRLAPIAIVAALLLVPTFVQAADVSSLKGIVVDEAKAEFTGSWTHSTSTKPYIADGYHHDGNTEKGQKQAKFVAKVPTKGEYRILFGYTPGSNRASNVPVTVTAGGTTKTVAVDQKLRPPLSGFVDLGQFKFEADQNVEITVSNKGTVGHVIVDAVQIVTLEEFKVVQAEAKKAPAPKKVAAKPIPVPLEPAPVFERQPAGKMAQLDAKQLDGFLRAELGEMAATDAVSDEIFLRRVTLDIVGRQPSVSELEEFLADTSSDKRSRHIDRLLTLPEYGRNWANYWSDVIGSRQQEPELTFHDYRPFKGWLAEQLHAGRRWDEITFDMLTARGKVGDRPQGTFIAFHQANPKRLAGETSRVFLGVKIHCAECHDHPFADIPMKTFHGMAAFFARTEAKIPRNESSQIELKSKTKGEHRIPGQKQDMKPVALHGIDGGEEFDAGIPDMKRRATLAQWIVHPENPYFARAYVNRIWSRMMGRGFYEPVDDLGETAEHWVLEDIHDQLAEHFIGSGFDHKEVVRLITNTEAYQRSIELPQTGTKQAFAAAKAKKLRGDEVFDSLVTAIGLANVQPEKAKPTGAIRFPIPPKSTRDLVNEAFGYDPSFKDDLLVRSMKQAMFMMNNTQLQAQIDASPESETYLSKLLDAENDDQRATIKLFHAVLARTPTEKELAIAMKHRQSLADRGDAFEDLLWSLINSAEFTTRR